MNGSKPCAWDIAVHLIEPLLRLSSPADEQIRWLVDKGVPPDELALEFDDGYQTLNKNCEYRKANGVTDELIRSLDAVDAALSGISGGENAQSWTMASLREKPEWERIRKLAREALILLKSNN